MTDFKAHPLPTERHPLTPFLPEGTKLLMLGSFPPPLSRWCMHFFYPNYINDMWRIFGLIFRGDRDALVDTEKRTFRLAEIKQLLCERHIGIFDTATEVRRLEGNASDKSLEIVRPTDLTALTSGLPALTAIAATGGKAAEEIAAGLNVTVPRTGTAQPVSISGRQLNFWRMPSSSRAYLMAIEKKAEAYRAMMRAEGIISE